jgi:ribonuclease-3
MTGSKKPEPQIEKAAEPSFSRAAKTPARKAKAHVHKAKSGETGLFGHAFKQEALLRRALTHRSLSYENDSENLEDPSKDNEQLEFIGDAVLGLVVAESLYRRFPQSREGELTRLRASIVSRRHLGKMAALLGLGAMLRLGKGEERSGGRSKPALLANAMEAVIAALYLDGGLEAAAAFIEKTIVNPALPELDLALAPAGVTGSNGSQTSTSRGSFSGAVGDHKSALQEHLQGIGAGQPEYVVTAETGPDHLKRFRIEVRVKDEAGASVALAESEGGTKKEAQQEAARLAFARLLADQVESGGTPA